MRPIYDLSRLQAASLPEASVLLPATIQADQHSTPYVNVDYSHNAIPTPAPTDSPPVPTFQQHIRRLVRRLAAIRDAIIRLSLKITTDDS